MPRKHPRKCPCCAEWGEEANLHYFPKFLMKVSCCVCGTESYSMSGCDSGQWKNRLPHLICEGCLKIKEMVTELMNKHNTLQANMGALPYSNLPYSKESSSDSEVFIEEVNLATSDPPSNDSESDCEITGISCGQCEKALEQCEC